MSLPTSFKLSSGYSIPSVGLGTGGLKGEYAQSVVLKAIELGYRHFDTSGAYGNEVDIGTAVRKSNVARGDIFIATKAWPTNMRPDRLTKAVLQSLADLQMDYIDLYQLHWAVSLVPDAVEAETGLVVPEDPQIPLLDSWRALEALVDLGKVRSIGVSNFSIAQLQEILAGCRIKPAVNQVECHPNFQQEELLQFCKLHDIVLVAYTPLGRNNHGAPRLTENASIVREAEKLGRDTGNLLVSWAVQRGIAPIPKSTSDVRLKSNLAIAPVPESTVKVLAGLETGKRNIDPVWWGIDVFGDHGGHANARAKAIEIAKAKAKQ